MKLELNLVTDLDSFILREKTLKIAEEVNIDEAFRNLYSH
jgi:hypothetical protein